MIELTENVEQAIRKHAEECYPRESCGLLVVVKGKLRYLDCRNVAHNPNDDFAIHREDYAKADELGEILAFVHSHPNMPARPSQADKVQCEAHGKPWFIVAVGVDGATDIHRHDPCGYEAPLLGRKFVHGVMDCYTLIRDYYRIHMGITLPEYEREDNWWNQGKSLYVDNYAAAGFYRVSGEPKVGDMIYMQIASKTPNHGAVYIGDGMIMHHRANRLSSRDLYDGYFQEVTTMVLRHKDAP